LPRQNFDPRFDAGSKVLGGGGAVPSSPFFCLKKRVRQSEIRARPDESKRVFKSLPKREIYFFAAKKVGNPF
jgi:hypothetical protein